MADDAMTKRNAAGRGFIDGLKNQLKSEKWNDRIYNIVGDDIFHDAYDSAKSAAEFNDFDRVKNNLGDAIARAEELRDAVLRNRDRFEEGEEVQEASTKMKKSELKEMIRAAFLQETTIQEAEEDEEEEGEAEDIDLEDVEIEADVDVDTGKSGIDVKQDADTDLAGVEGEVQDNLEAALDKAKKLGDEKLVDQIGNTLTFFTRQHVVK